MTEATGSRGIWISCQEPGCLCEHLEVSLSARGMCGLQVGAQRRAPQHLYWATFLARSPETWLDSKEFTRSERPLRGLPRPGITLYFSFFFLSPPHWIWLLSGPPSVCLLSTDDDHVLCQWPLAPGFQEDPPSQESCPLGSCLLKTLIGQCSQPLHSQFLQFSLLKNTPFVCSAASAFKACLILSNFSLSITFFSEMWYCCCSVPKPCLTL